MRRSPRSWIACCCGIGLLLAIAAAAPARQVEITLKNGRTVSGEFVSETANSVTIRIADIETTYPRSQVQEMRVKRSLREEYRQRRSELEADDHAGHYKLARWLYNQDTAEGYRLALEELDRLIEAKPDHRQAKLLRDVVRKKLEKQDGSEPAPESGDEGGSGKMEGREAEGPDVKLLSEEQIRLIKVFEVDLAEEPQVQLPQATIERLFESYGNDPLLQPYRGGRGLARFRRLRGYEQLGLLFDLKARELYDEVRVRDEPETLRNFRTQVHTNYVIRHCGRCHGRGRAPGFYVVTRGVSSERVAYTNYMLLRRTRVNDRPLINRERPAQSALLQYGLRREEAETPHPQVTGYRAYFNNGTEDSRYRGMVRWIDRLWGETERYPIEFEPPKGFGGSGSNGGEQQQSSHQADPQNGGGEDPGQSGGNG